MTSVDPMAAVTVDNAQDPTPADGAFLFINITGPTDGRRREASAQRMIRQHVMRDTAKTHRKPPQNPYLKLNTAALASKDSSEDKTNHANTTGASALKYYPEEQRDRANVITTTTSHINALETNDATKTVPTTAIDGSTLGTPKRHSPDCQQPVALVDLALEQHPLATLYQRLVSASKFPAYSLAYAVFWYAKLDRKPHDPLFALFLSSID
jgi:hypothetical protein